MAEEKIKEELDTQDDPSRASEASSSSSSGRRAGLVSGFLSGTPSSLAPKEVLAGRYELLSLVGAGGMGTVYRARDRELDEEVALKVLKRELVDTPGMLDRFRREVKLARRVTHRNVARAYDIGEHGDDKFLTMEYVDGEPLSQLVAREGRLACRRIIDVAREVCEGLSAAHAAGVVHRDLKPDNVLIAKDGRVVITDFGIARALTDVTARTQGVAVGTPAYMAPEQVEGAGDIDARADVYALGVMLYELFTGEHPWRGETAYAVAAARLMHPPPDPRKVRPQLPEALSLIVLRAMARAPSARFASARALGEALAHVPADQATSNDTPAMPHAPTMVLRAEPESKTVAVLPFRSAGSPDDEYLADGLTEDLIDLLSTTQGLRVRPRGAVIHLKGQSRDVRELGRELGVQVVVEGSLRKAGDAVRVSTRLLSVQDGFQLWAKRFDRRAQDVLSVSDEMATAIASALTVEAQAPARSAPTDPAALDAYFRARFEYHKYDRESVAKAVTLFEQALRLAPDEPMILTGYAVATTRLWFFGAEGSADKARMAAERAMALAPGRAEPHVALAALRFQQGRCVEAVLEAKKAVAINAALPDSYDLLGRMLLETGPVPLGIENYERAFALDPAFRDGRFQIARALALTGEAERADSMLRALIDERGTVGAWVQLARSLGWRRDSEAARAALADPRLAEPRNAAAVAILQHVVSPNEENDPSAHIMVSLDVPGASWRAKTLARQSRAELFAGRRLDDQALDAIEDATRSGLIDVVWLDGCRLFDPIRQHPRFLASRAVVEARASAIRNAAS